MPESNNPNTVSVTADEQAAYLTMADAIGNNIINPEMVANRLAAVGYAAYGQTTGFKNFQGTAMPGFDELPEKQLTAWFAAARAIRTHLIQNATAADFNAWIKIARISTNELSDGYHAFGELYDHRITLWIALCRKMQLLSTEGIGFPPVWRSRRHADGELAYGGGWFVLGIGIKDGKQITYHLPDARWAECDFAEEFTVAPEWDQHTADDVLKRIRGL